jgi:hypothetical protein
VKRTVAIDFDGVLAHYDGNYREGQLGEPHPAAIKTIQDYIAADMDVVIHTTRARTQRGVSLILAWLVKHGITKMDLTRMAISSIKPVAYVYIDDRAIQFNGTFPTAQQIREYKTWDGR